MKTEITFDKLKKEFSELVTAMQEFRFEEAQESNSDYNKDENTLLNKAIEKVILEYHSACKQYPLWPKHIVRQVAYIAEESGEAVREANMVADDEGGTMKNLECEVVQTAAMCLRYIIGSSEKPDVTPAHFATNTASKTAHMDSPGIVPSLT